MGSAEIGLLFQMGQVGLGLYGATKARNAAISMQSTYAQEAALNHKIGEFNAEMAMKTGEATVETIATMTRRVVAQQRSAFSGRGVSMEGSPQLVIGDTISMGRQQAQEAYFDAEVKATNAKYTALSAVSAANASGSNAKYSALSSTIDFAKQVMGIGSIAASRDVLNSSNVDSYKRSIGVSSSSVYDFWKGNNSGLAGRSV